MVSREDMGSWLEGTPGGQHDGRGARLGLPPDGPGSLATLGRRVVALVIDWVLATLVAFLFFRPAAPGFFEGISALPVWSQPLVFAIENVLLVSTLGFTVGHRVMGMRVRRLAEPARMVGVGRGLLRTVLLCLVIPAVVWDADGRGLHDRAAGTVLVRT
ncbi:RDD family protein [Cellulosimicrobium cellulans]|uniref:RDD family protein n=1 Tax=Cellulosimicrobium cellulans TaxID=1710 RepID=UPI001963523A|nr:RDD family protein [Cellulosimicrobium cellulans]MBN0042352.1 RDD family protein [Cellulosimicrobium cellulans]